MGVIGLSAVVPFGNSMLLVELITTSPPMPTAMPKSITWRLFNNCLCKYRITTPMYSQWLLNLQATLCWLQFCHRWPKLFFQCQMSLFHLLAPIVC